MVMYAGRVVECAGAKDLLAHPRHPYTAELLKCIPTLSGPRLARLPTLIGQPPRPGEVSEGCAFAPRCPRAAERCRAERPPLESSCGLPDRLPLSVVFVNDPLLRVRDLWVELGGRRVLRGLSFDLFAGETLGLVGESGSGKTTLARSVLRLLRSSSGRIEFEGMDLLACDPKSLHAPSPRSADGVSRSTGQSGSAPDHRRERG